MRILVSAASKHGATAEIAGRIGTALSARFPDAEVVVQRPRDVSSVDRFDAYILGSAVYMGHWLDEARQLIQDHRGWRDKQVWLFSSGPIGDPPIPNEQPVDVGEAVTATRARQHHLFAGALVRERLGFAERAMVAALRAPYGDYRDWDAVDAWANTIADTLTAT